MVPDTGRDADVDPRPAAAALADLERQLGDALGQARVAESERDAAIAHRRDLEAALSDMQAQRDKALDDWHREMIGRHEVQSQLDGVRASTSWKLIWAAGAPVRFLRSRRG